MPVTYLIHLPGEVWGGGWHPPASAPLQELWDTGQEQGLQWAEGYELDLAAPKGANLVR